jgi:hypothetical protein
MMIKFLKKKIEIINYKPVKGAKKNLKKNCH